MLNGSLGLSQVKYPFSDGTSQRDFAPYVATGLRYEAWRSLLLIAGYKQDVIQRRLELGVEYKGLRLSAYSAKGINGVPGDQGVMLTADLLALTRPSGLSRGSLAERVKLRSGQDVGRQVLVDAMARPVQLPQTFVAKVDPTAVTQIDINKSGLPQGATVDPKTGDITFQVGSAGLSVSDITRQVAGASGGGPFTNAGQFSISGNSVTVHVRHLPVPASVDSYVISLIDGTGVQYRAKVSGQRGAV